MNTMINIDNKESTKATSKAVVKILKAVDKYNTSDKVAIKALDLIENALMQPTTIQDCTFYAQSECQK